MICSKRILSVFILMVGLTCCLAEQQTGTDKINKFLDIRSVTVSGRSVALNNGKEANLGANPNDIIFDFDVNSNAEQSPIRLQYKLDGYDNKWQLGSGEMFFEIRFYNTQGDQINQILFPVQNDSAGWEGSFETSPLIHRRESVVVPPQASRLSLVISSAGSPATLGVYAVANLVVLDSRSNSPPVLLLESPFSSPLAESTNFVLRGWVRDGVRPSMAKIVQVGHDSKTTAFAIMDNDITAHAEWRSVDGFAPSVNPNDHLVIEWDEMYSVGMEFFHSITYNGLPAGNYQFRVIGVDIMGKPTGLETSLKIIVPQPFWRTRWFLSLVISIGVVLVIGIERYVVWNKMNREMTYLNGQKALEQERLRIARDIHDDVGARVTQISLVSASFQTDHTLPLNARTGFEEIKQMSQDLVSALYETVWAVNPEYDNFEALGDYICQMANTLCNQAQLRCRLQMEDLPPNIQISSQVRHNIVMVAKEALHNAIKHARASEVAILILFANDVLDMTLQDNGCGMQANDCHTGNGLVNMKQRMKNIGGSCWIESKLGCGTTVHLRWKTDGQMVPE